ncbi:MAG: cobalamin-dependent protein [Candidatus Thiodiazotropha endolucinida]
MVQDPPTTQSLSESLDSFLVCLIKGDREMCSFITEEVLRNGTPIPALYQGLFQPALYRVGELWAENRISVATEHMATAITEGLLNQVYPRLINRHRSGRKAMLATVEEELHQVGAKMAADVFEMHGWDGLFLGSGRSTYELLSALKEEQPDILGLSFSVYDHLDSLTNMITRVRSDYPDLPILIGGQGLNQGGEELEEAFSKVTCVRNLDELDAVITHISC